MRTPLACSANTSRRSDLRVHRPEHLATVAAQLNRRPREILARQSPMEHLQSPMDHLASLASPPTEPLTIATCAEFRPKKRQNFRPWFAVPVESY